MGPIIIDTPLALAMKYTTVLYGVYHYFYHGESIGYTQDKWHMDFDTFTEKNVDSKKIDQEVISLLNGLSNPQGVIPEPFIQYFMKLWDGQDLMQGNNIQRQETLENRVQTVLGSLAAYDKLRTILKDIEKKSKDKNWDRTKYRNDHQLIASLQTISNNIINQDNIKFEVGRFLLSCQLQQIDKTDFDYTYGRLKEKFLKIKPLSQQQIDFLRNAQTKNHLKKLAVEKKGKELYDWNSNDWKNIARIIAGFYAIFNLYFYDFTRFLRTVGSYGWVVGRFVLPKSLGTVLSKPLLEAFTSNSTSQYWIVRSVLKPVLGEFTLDSIPQNWIIQPAMFNFVAKTLGLAYYNTMEVLPKVLADIKLLAQKGVAYFNMNQPALGELQTTPGEIAFLAFQGFSYFILPKIGQYAVSASFTSATLFAAPPVFGMAIIAPLLVACVLNLPNYTANMAFFVSEKAKEALTLGIWAGSTVLCAKTLGIDVAIMYGAGSVITKLAYDAAVKGKSNEL